MAAQHAGRAIPCKSTAFATAAGHASECQGRSWTDTPRQAHSSRSTSSPGRSIRGCPYNFGCRPQRKCLAAGSCWVAPLTLVGGPPLVEVVLAQGLARGLARLLAVVPVPERTHSAACTSTASATEAGHSNARQGHNCADTPRLPRSSRSTSWWGCSRLDCPCNSPCMGPCIRPALVLGRVAAMSPAEGLALAQEARRSNPCRSMASSTAAGRSNGCRGNSGARRRRPPRLFRSTSFWGRNMRGHPYNFGNTNRRSLLPAR